MNNEVKKDGFTVVSSIMGAAEQEAHAVASNPSNARRLVWADADDQGQTGSKGSRRMWVPGGG